MGFCRAFFGDFNDWLHQNHHFSFEPSGISKTKVLFQAVNILQVAEHVYLALGDEQNDFFVKTFERVKTGSEFLKKLVDANIKRMRGGDIEKVLSTLQKPKDIPFYFSQPIEPNWCESKKSDADLKALDEIFQQNGTVDMSIVLVTEMVATDGSEATSLLSFVHPTNQPESEEAESLNQQTTLSSAKGPSDSVPSTSASKEEPFSSRINVFTKRLNQNDWDVDPAPSLNKFLRGAKLVLSQSPGAEELKARSSGWPVMLAHLLKRCDEEIEKNGLRCGDRWRSIFGYFQQIFQTRNSETIKTAKPERQIFLWPSVKLFFYHGTDYNLGWILDHIEWVENLLGAPQEEISNASVCVACPDCQGRFTFTLANFALHRLNAHPKLVLESLKCPLCGRCYEKEGSLKTHLIRDENYSVPESVECLICHRCYKNKRTLASHVSRDHKKLKSDQKRKPEESVCATPEAKRTSQVQSHQHSYPSVSPPKDRSSDIYDLLESVTPTTSYNSRMPYSDHLNPVHDYQEENSKIPSPKSTDLPTVSEEDFTIEELDDARMDEFIRSITQS